MLSAAQRARQHMQCKRQAAAARKRIDTLNTSIRAAGEALAESVAAHPSTAHLHIATAQVHATLAVASAILAGQAEASTLALGGYPRDITDWSRDEEHTPEAGADTIEPVEPS